MIRPALRLAVAVIKGVVHHCTEMELDRQYVDSHGQSTVAFAFCRLLDLQLMSRLKAIPTQELHRPFYKIDCTNDSLLKSNNRAHIKCFLKKIGEHACSVRTISQLKRYTNPTKSGRHKPSGLAK